MSDSSILSFRNLTRALWRRRSEITEISLVGYATLILAFLLQVMIVRLLGPEQFGRYSTALAIVALIEVPLIVRGTEIALRMLRWEADSTDGARFLSLQRAMLRYDVALYLAGCMAVVALAWLLRGFLSVDPWLLTILAFVIPAQTGFGVFKSYFVIFDRIREIVRYELRFTIVQAALNVCGILLWGVYGLAISMVVAMVAKSWMAYRSTRRWLPKKSAEGEVGVLSRELTREGSLSVVRNIFSNGLMQLDVVLLGLLQRPEQVALYKVGKSLASIPLKASQPAWRYLQPRLREAAQVVNRRAELRVVLAGSAALVLAFVAILPVGWWFGEWLLASIYGEVYRGAYALFVVLLVGVWLFQGVAGWFKFWVVVTPSRSIGIAIYAAAAIAMTILGATVGGTSPLNMAYAYTAVMALTTVAAYGAIWARR